MQISNYRFQPRLIPALAVLALLALFIHLGLWQADKAERGQAQRLLYETRSNQPPIPIGQPLLDTKEIGYARVTVRGEYEVSQQFYIDNQIEDGRPGVHVITPLKIDGGDTRILINRGWVSWADRHTAPHAPTPGGAHQITGIAVTPVKQNYFLMPDHREAWPELRSTLDMAAYVKNAAYPVQPVILYETSRSQDDGLIKHVPQPEDKIAMHNGYAIQWFGMAVALLGFYFVVSFRKRA